MRGMGNDALQVALVGVAVGAGAEFDAAWIIAEKVMAATPDADARTLSAEVYATARDVAYGFAEV